MMQNIILFGTGDRGKKIFQFLQEVGADILFWIDSDPDKWNIRLFDLPVYQPGTVRQPHTIDVSKCVKCGACMEKCKFGAISKG